MAKKEKIEPKTLLLRNTNCAFTCPWVHKLDGSDDHSFAKDEIFEAPLTVKRIRNGKEVDVDTMELLKAMFPHGIEIAKGAVSLSKIKEKDEEIAKLKAELASLKKGKKEDPVSEEEGE